MTKTRKKVAAILVLVLLMATGIILVLHRQPSFVGSRVKNPDAYLLDIQQMNGTDEHTLELEAGDVLQVGFETEKGSLHMKMTAPDGNTLYDGNGKAVASFTLQIPESGAYSIWVEGRRAQGTIRIQRKEP